MLKKLQEKLLKSKENINNIKNAVNNCNSTNCRDGYVYKKVNIFGASMELPALCTCSYSTEMKTIQDYYAEIENLQSANYIIDNHIADHFRPHLDLNNQEISGFYKQNKYNILWIAGKMRTGKTTLLYSLWVDSIINNIDYKFISETDIKIEYGQAIKPIENNRYFAIDDAGIRLNDALEQYYFELIDDKYQNRTKLIITSNYTIKEFAERFKNKDIGLRIYDRFCRVGKMIIKNNLEAL